MTETTMASASANDQVEEDASELSFPKGSAFVVYNLVLVTIQFDLRFIVFCVVVK